MSRTTSHLGRFGLNLTLLIGLGLLVSWWFLHYTSLFPVIGGLLGLGGVLAWAAFVSGLITDERKEQLQHAFEDRVLLSRTTPIVLLTLGLGWATVFSFFGSVEVAAIRDAVNRTVEVYPAGAGSGEAVTARGGTQELLRELFLPARGSSRFVLPTPWLGSRTYRIRVSGLPSAEVEVRAWRRRMVTVPDSFVTRPVLLLWPSPAIGNQLRVLLDEGGRARLTVRLYENTEAEQPAEARALEDYAGEAVWVGYDREYELPQDVLDRWSRTTVDPEVAERWRSPRAIGGVALKAGQRVEVLLEYSYARDSSPADFLKFLDDGWTVRAVVHLADLPQKEVLDGR